MAYDEWKPALKAAERCHQEAMNMDQLLYENCIGDNVPACMVMLKHQLEYLPHGGYSGFMSNALQAAINLNKAQAAMFEPAKPPNFGPAPIPL